VHPQSPGTCAHLRPRMRGLDPADVIDRSPESPLHTPRAVLAPGAGRAAMARGGVAAVDWAADPPVELLEQIFLYLSARDLLAAAQACRLWRVAATSEPLWYGPAAVSGSAAAPGRRDLTQGCEDRGGSGVHCGRRRKYLEDPVAGMAEPERETTWRATSLWYGMWARRAAPAECQQAHAAQLGPCARRNQAGAGHSGELERGRVRVPQHARGLRVAPNGRPDGGRPPASAQHR